MFFSETPVTQHFSKDSNESSRARKNRERWKLIEMHNVTVSLYLVHSKHNCKQQYASSPESRRKLNTQMSWTREANLFCISSGI